MSKHTPGPWEHNDYQIIETKTEKVIANCTYGGRNPNNANDARLIAAAPDLLAALQEINERLQDHPAFPRDFSGLEAEEIEAPDGDSAEFKYLSDIAQSAIDKATGETK
jgi:hypothetical protein